MGKSMSAFGSLSRMRASPWRGIRVQFALATGIAASGSSLGGVIYPIVLYKVLRKVGFSWAVRIIGFIALAIPSFRW